MGGAKAMGGGVGGAGGAGGGVGRADCALAWALADCALSRAITRLVSTSTVFSSAAIRA